MQKSTAKILQILKNTYPSAECALVHDSPLQLLVATILSAQCTDKRVNVVTKELFGKYKNARDFSRANPQGLEKEIRSTGFYRQKGRWIREACKIIAEKHGGRVPDNMDQLLHLPGVARKTANVVMGTAFGIASGIVVDTHVKRVSKRLGLTRHEDPVKVEEDLIKIIPREEWIWFAHALISHGRQICKALAPLCPQCPLNKVCPAVRMGNPLEVSK